MPGLKLPVMLGTRHTVVATLMGEKHNEATGIYRVTITIHASQVRCVDGGIDVALHFEHAFNNLCGDVRHPTAVRGRVLVLGGLGVVLTSSPFALNSPSATVALFRSTDT